MSTYVSVVLDVPTHALDAPFTYRVPTQHEDSQDSLFVDKNFTSTDAVLQSYVDKHYKAQIGCAVLVPLGGRRAVGYIVGIKDDSGLCNGIFSDAPLHAKTKDIIAVLSKPFFYEDSVHDAFWLSKYYVAPLFSCIKLYVPSGCSPRCVRNSGKWVLKKPTVGEVDNTWVVLGDEGSDFIPRRGAAKQEAILRAVRAGDVRVSELVLEFGSVASSLKSLEKQGAIKLEQRRRMRTPEGMLSGANVMKGGIKLTQGQKQALSVITNKLHGSGGVVLVDGVTGSGKTEVYLQSIQEVVDLGKTAIVLVPEISLTPQTVARFRGRFGNAVAVMHSRMSAGERYDQWDYIQSGFVSVVVGARSALFTPLRNVGLIVIDEEHESSYKQDCAPRYHARNLALHMMKNSGGVVVLGSATPSIESLYAAQHEKDWQQVCLPDRANGSTLPPISVVNMALEFSGGHRSMFSRCLTKALQEELSKNNKVVLLLNQRGFAKFMLCRDCGFVPECPHCSTSLVYHEKGNFLMCHHCDYRVAAPATCPECSSPYLKKFGAGTQRVESELLALINSFSGIAKDAQVIRMDADTTRTKGAHQKLLEQFANASGAVLLGTQMIAKGLDFKDVSLVGVINADTQLNLPDYRAGERTFDLILQVAGRAGRAEIPGRVIVQTYQADALPITAAAQYNRELFLSHELSKRNSLNYPPYIRIANVLIWGKKLEEVKKYANVMHDTLVKTLAKQSSDDCCVLPAAPCVLGKLRSAYRYHIVIKYSNDCSIEKELKDFLLHRRVVDSINVAIDIDPADVL